VSPPLRGEFAKQRYENLPHEIEAFDKSTCATMITLCDDIGCLRGSVQSGAETGKDTAMASESNGVHSKCSPWQNQSMRNCRSNPRGNPW